MDRRFQSLVSEAQEKHMLRQLGFFSIALALVVLPAYESKNNCH
jgi:hypothetical protein